MGKLFKTQNEILKKVEIKNVGQKNGNEASKQILSF
jgi:hypothetical protein